ncbi:MAG: Holliday junction resolvase RuvX [Polycyclovorans sp.]|jgi:putative holliday junction resolvase|nr:Holliday junction resolvase RuvX [Gammaproteobacteria bacterium]MDP1543033.1 Holliday junction resolvase RuvX [Polycyclovorans sp.]MEC8849271.1 Holliday junction resolvase RuvX [Pseudomonadota bacterium]|tara:strand:- start:20792 stop:21253 length:462 start_codon:yes stop_codon:yes gene_type:complete
MAVLAFDVGHKRIGVAVGEALTGNARALPTLHPDDIAHLDRLWRDWAPDAVVIGWPLTEDGQTQAATALAASFALQLQHRYGVAVYLCDERYSSRSADDHLRRARASGQMNRRVRKTDRDAEAARIILEQWFLEAAAGRLRPFCDSASAPPRA